MSARYRFKIGDRVRLTTRAVRQGLASRKFGCVGTVTGFGGDPWFLYVLLDGQKRPVRYHEDHWKPFVSRKNRPQSRRHQT